MFKSKGQPLLHPIWITHQLYLQNFGLVLTPSLNKISPSRPCNLSRIFISLCCTIFTWYFKTFGLSYTNLNNTFNSLRWFLPGCPLAKLFGPDPFNIYPWDKFCGRYTDFDDSPFCKEKARDITSMEKETRQPRVE